MSSFYTVEGADKTVSGSGDTTKSMEIFKWNCLHANGINRIDDASHYLWDLHRPTKEGKYKGDAADTEWDDLSRSEKLGLIELRFKGDEKKMAMKYNTMSQTSIARATAETENETDYEDD